MILPKTSFLEFPEQTQYIIKSLIDDILFMRKDREVEVEFFFSNRYLKITLDYGYIHLRKGTELEFKYEYDYDVFTNVNKILSEAIERSMIDDHAHFSEIDIKKSKKFFEHIKILDDALCLDGRLFDYTKKTPFKTNVYKLKDTFENFEVVKTANSSMCIKLINDKFDVSSYHEEIVFNFNGVRILFRPEKMAGHFEVVSTIQNLISTLSK